MTYLVAASLSLLSSDIPSQNIPALIIDDSRKEEEIKTLEVETKNQLSHYLMLENVYLVIFLLLSLLYPLCINITYDLHGMFSLCNTYVDMELGNEPFTL